MLGIQAGLAPTNSLLNFLLALKKTQDKTAQKLPQKVSCNRFLGWKSVPGAAEMEQTITSLSSDDIELHYQDFL